MLTSYEPTAYPNVQAWNREFEKAVVHVQWDPERSLRGGDMGYNSIQVGLSRHIIQRYVDEWVVSIEDYTPLTRKIHALLKAGKSEKAKVLLPREKIYPTEPDVVRKLNIKTYKTR